MIIVIIPLVVLFSIILFPIPRIGKNLIIAFLSTAVISLLLGGVGIKESIVAAIYGIDGIAWVMLLILIASMYTQSQFVLGSVETVLNIFRSLFGKSTKGLITAILITLAIAGSVIGSATAAATVIGLLVIEVLNEIRLKPNQISAIILMGAIIGSIMPPISQATFLASGIVGSALDPAINITYFTVGIGLIISIFTCRRFTTIDKLPEELIPKRSASKIISQEWRLLIPLMVFASLIVLRSALKIDLLKYTDSLWNITKGIPILRAFTNRYVQSIIVAILIAMCYPKVFKSTRQWVTKGINSVKKPLLTVTCAGIMIGAFKASGMIDAIVKFSERLSPATIKIGGGASVLVMGMLTGSQSATQTSLDPLLAPLLIDVCGVPPVNTSVALAHLAMAGQSFPPVGILAIMLAAIVASFVNKKTDPLQVMVLSLPVTIYFALVGFAALWVVF